MKSIDGDILYQSIDPLTKSVSPSFYEQFGNVGEETLNFFIELKTTMTSHISKRNENIVSFFRKLDSQLTTLPTPIQDWFKRFFKHKLSPEAKALILDKGPLKSLDKTFSFDSMNKLVDPLNWYTGNSLPPAGSMTSKVPCNMGTCPKGLNSADLSMFASKMAKIRVCKERAMGAVVPKLSSPEKTHGENLVGDYKFAERMAKIAAEYYKKILQLLGDNAQYVMDNFKFKSSTNNVQTGAPNIKVPAQANGKAINTNIYGTVTKPPTNSNPFIPKLKD